MEERNELSREFPDIVEQLREEMERESLKIWTAPHGIDLQCDRAAILLYGGYYGPWKEL